MEKESGMERMLAFIEKDRFGIIAASVILFVLAYLRSFLEAAVFEYPVSLYLRVNHVALDFALFIVGVVIITSISGINYRKVFNVVLFGWPIILIPPIIDFLMGSYGAGKGYPYFSEPNFVKAFLMFFDVHRMAEIGWGEFVQLWGIVIISAVYVFLRKRSVIRSFMTGFGLLLFMAYINVSMAIIRHVDLNNAENTVNIVFFGIWKSPIQIKYYSYLIPLVGAGTHPTLEEYIGLNYIQQSFLFVGLYYTVMFLIFAGIFMYIADRKRFKEFLSMSSLSYIAVLVSLVFVGGVLNSSLYVRYALHTFYLGFAMLSVAATVQVWTMLYHISQDEWKARTFSREQYRNVMIAFAALSVVSAYILGNGPFILAILLLFLGYLHNCRPFYARKSRLSPMPFAMAASIAFLMGFYTPSYWLLVVFGRSSQEYDPSMFKEMRIPASHPLSGVAIAAILLSAIVGLIYYFLIVRKDEDV